MGIEAASCWQKMGKWRSTFEVYNEGEQGQGEEGGLEGSRGEPTSFESQSRTSEIYQCDPHMY